MFKNEKGFTLLEVLISAAAIAFLSGFILQMFIVSNNVNSRAKDLDQANLISVSAIEEFKSGQKPEDFYTSEFIDKGIVKEKDTETDIFLCYDAGWNRIEPPADIESYPNVADLSDVKFLLTLKITAVEEDGFEAFRESAAKIGLADGEGTGRLYKISAVVKNCSAPEDEQTMLNLTASKYFVR